MRQFHQLPHLGLLVIFLISSQRCKTSEVYEQNQLQDLSSLLNTLVNSNYTNGVQAASALLSLRLVGIQNQKVEEKLIQKVMEYVLSRESYLSSGQLAWTIMALGACLNPHETFIDDFHLEKLEEKFQEEIRHMETHNGNPVTNYYQLSQSVLALCLFHGNYLITEIAEFFTPENKNYYFGGQFSVDTGAMAVLALTCVKRSITNQQIKVDQSVTKRIENHIGILVKNILSQKKENGLLGNIYSTGEAMQALLVSSHYYNKGEWDYQRTLDTVSKEISQGAFKIPIAAAQILPAVMGKTYLDVNKDSPCSVLNVSIPESGSENPPHSSSLITVHYTVKTNSTFSTDVTVQNGSVFLDVMEKAQEQNKTVFGFTMIETAWGPYITSVQGITADNGDRTYWEILSGEKPLSQGVGSYVVHDGEDLEIRWSTY